MVPVTASPTNAAGGRQAAPPTPSYLPPVRTRFSGPAPAGPCPVMVRHSAAHRGVEREVCPRAAQRGASLITFSNTCYGRLLQPHNGMPPPTAADCYRYTLMQAAVRACLSAPRTLATLE